jgi:hypothetical protein
MMLARRSSVDAADGGLVWPVMIGAFRGGRQMTSTHANASKEPISATAAEIDRTYMLGQVLAFAGG